ncbi:hypothetical protein [Calderihabitans maritimus]|uniref:Uncharacterized protein n=1 Tax=Calderihabitans maritimus TaxID=1246530 RepID=A0A1Z5HRU7_9FIRM|nr:hypothetical protein [Calderihabitans maritimus]GAW92045.1 hypothetical protein MTY_0821 [Calderihabitans maritimus]
MIFGILFIAGLALSLIYYLYRQSVDEGINMFPVNDIAKEKHK